MNEHKFRHKFRATIDPMCNRGLEPETTLHYLLRFNPYFDLTKELPNNICVLNPTLKNLSHEKLLNILLYGSENFSFNSNKKMKSTIKFLKTSERFIDPLFWPFFSKEYWMNLFKDYIYICMQHLNASILWLVSVLGPVLCRFYSF